MRCAWVLVTLIFVSLVITGCGGDKDASSTTSSSSSTSSAPSAPAADTSSSASSSSTPPAAASSDASAGGGMSSMMTAGGPPGMPPGGGGAPPGGMPNGPGGMAMMTGAPPSGGPPGMMASGPPGAMPSGPGTGMMSGMMAGGPPGMMPGGPGAQFTSTGPGGSAAAAKNLTFGEQAVQEFQQGNHRKAFQYLFAEYLSNDKAARDNYEKMQWVAGLKHPAIAVRWGIGIQYSSGSYKGDAKPIGSTQQISKKRGGGGPGGAPGGMGMPGGMAGGMAPGGAPGAMAMPGGMPGGMPGMGSPGAGARGSGAKHPLIDQYTGEYGKKILEQLEQRITQGGVFGVALKDALVSPGGLATSSGPQGAMPGGMPGMMSGMMAGGPPGMMPGGPGGGMPGMMPGGMMPGGGVKAAGADANGVQQLIPGLVMLGVGKNDDMLKIAKAQELDLLIMFDVDVAENKRNNTVSNTTRVVLYNVELGELVKDVPAKALNNLKVQQTREKESDKDPVDEAVAQFFKYIDDNFVMTPFPEGATKQHVQVRIDKLLASNDSQLQKLNEIRFYRSRNLISNEDVVANYYKILGPGEGKKLATGSEAKKKEVLKKMLK